MTKLQLLFTFIAAAILTVNGSRIQRQPDDSQLINAVSNVDISDSSWLAIPSGGTVFTLTGLNFNLYNYMPKIFRGMFAAPPYQMVKINYPASLGKNSITRGVAQLDAALKSTPGQKIVLAHSQGAQVCSRWMREHASDPEAPAPGDLVFILAGNPLRSAGGGYIIGRKEVGGTTGMPTPTNTPWHIIDVARRYDGWADWVQDENNSLAVENAKKGKRTVHPHYEDIDLFDSTHTIWSQGNTTYVLTEEKIPPILQGKSATAEEVQRTRAVIETAYTNRPQ